MVEVHASVVLLPYGIHVQNIQRGLMFLLTLIRRHRQVYNTRLFRYSEYIRKHKDAYAHLYPTIEFFRLLVYL